MTHVLLGPADFDDRIPDRESCIFWQDDLSIGPVPSTPTLEDLTTIRERFWESTHFGLEMPGNDQQTPFSILSERDKQLRRVIESQDEIVVWSGPNRREILMLCAVLRFFPSSALQKVSVAQCPQWGALIHSAEDLALFFKNRAPVWPELVQLSLELWSRYTNPDPKGLDELMKRLVQERHPLQTALRWILEEYPSVANGLSRVEEALIRNVRGPDSILKIVARTIGNSEDTIADTQLYETVWEFLTARVPVLESSDSQKHSFEPGSLKEFRRLTVQPTSLAFELLKNNSDYIAVDGIDRWIGGVHLQGHAVGWRFDSAAGHLISADAQPDKLES